MMKKVLRMTCALTVGLGISMLTSCRNPITFQVVAGFNKPVPVVEKGDVLTWKAAGGGSDMPVTFKPVSPCKPSDGNPTATCHVNVDGGIFPYTCDQCDDPVVPVKSGIGILQKLQMSVARAKTTGNPAYAGVYCDDQHKATAVTETASAKQQFQWIPAGTSPPGTWTVTVADGTCLEGSVFGPSSLLCTVKDGATSQNYNVHVEGCTDGKAQLTVP